MFLYCCLATDFDQFCSGNIHRTTSVNGKYVPDPKGDHVTICFKDEKQVQDGTHVASHGYVTNVADNFLREATHSEPKLDGTIKKNGKEVWPASLKEICEVGFSHLARGIDGTGSSSGI